MSPTAIALSILWAKDSTQRCAYRDGRVGGDTLLGLLPAFPSGNVELYEDFIGT
jgi:hypothetical protein